MYPRCILIGWLMIIITINHQFYKWSVTMCSVFSLVWWFHFSLGCLLYLDLVRGMKQEIRGCHMSPEAFPFRQRSAEKRGGCCRCARCHAAALNGRSMRTASLQKWRRIVHQQVIKHGNCGFRIDLQNDRWTMWQTFCFFIVVAFICYIDRNQQQDSQV